MSSARLPLPMPLLIQVLRAPGAMAALDLRQWELLLRQALRANLTASLHALVQEHALLASIPAPARAQLEWAATLAERHGKAVEWEVRQIREALAGVVAPVILLKGAAYAAARLPAGQGRLFSDIDILIDRVCLAEVESRLMQHGWVSTHHDAYDQRYYREWMHEIPPMVHVRRDSMIDVHHTILPLTARSRPDPAKLRAASIPLPGQPGLATLAPADMVLHSATHLFYDGEYDKGLRDLYDLHRLLGQFGADAAFWAGLPGRALELELARPLFYALRYAKSMLGTAVPDDVLVRLQPAAPGAPVLALMDGLFGRALLPMHASCSDAWSGMAHKLLYVRGNWLRMPPLLLARHLFHKAFLSPRATSD